MRKIHNFESFSENCPDYLDEGLVKFWETQSINENFSGQVKFKKIASAQKDYIKGTSNNGGDTKKLEEAVKNIEDLIGTDIDLYLEFLGSELGETLGVGICGKPQLEIFDAIYSKHAMLPKALNSSGMQNIIESTNDMYKTLEDVVASEAEISSFDNNFTVPEETITRIKQDLQKRDQILPILEEYLSIIEAVEKDDFNSLSDAEKERAVACFEVFCSDYKKASDLKNNSPKFFEGCDKKSEGSGSDFAVLGDLGF